MRGLTAAELLDVWEQGEPLSWIERALLLLVAACPETPASELAQLSIGQRDTQLLALREWMFGSEVVSVVTCPQCGDRLEFTFAIADIRVPNALPPQEQWSLNLAEYEIWFRLPNSLDLAAITTAPLSADEAQQLLLDRCLIAIQHQGKPWPPGSLPSSITVPLIEHMAEVDPQADIQLSLTCPNCQHDWQAPFDIVSFFWREIQAWALRTLREVHLLARAYGWHESDILAMSAGRRRLYLELVGAS